MISGIIMASGFSKRMGEDKLLLEFEGKQVVEHVIEAARASRLDEVIVVCKDAAIVKMAESLGAAVVFNANAQLGQSESIRLGAKGASPKADGFMFIAADMPLLESSVIDLLICAFSKSKDSIVMPLYKGVRGNPVIFPSDLRADLLSLKGEEGGKAIIERFGERVIFVETGSSLGGFDIDTKEDFEWLKVMREKTDSNK